MQDADESSLPSIMPPKEMVEAGVVVEVVPATPQDMAKDEKIEELDQALANVLVKNEEEKSPEIPKVEEKKKDEEPEGYEMCDMETGMCYWVPAKKVKSDVEDNTKPEETSTTVEDTETSPPKDEASQEDKPEEPKGEEPQGYQVCDMETGMCYWVPANKEAQLAPAHENKEEGPVVKFPEVEVSSIETCAEPAPKSLAPLEISTLIMTNNSTSSSNPETLIESFSSSRSNTASPEPSQQDQSGQHNSGSSSPSQSLAPGPRLVGKLSRDRLAMFERGS